MEAKMFISILHNRGKYFSLFASKRWGTISEIRGFREEFFIFESFLSVVFAEI